MKRNHFLTLALGIMFSASGCVSPHGGPVPLYWLSAIGPKGGGGYSTPKIEGTDGSSPGTALKIRESNKDYLAGEELSWVHDQYWWPLKAGRPHTEYSRSWTEFRPNATHETKRIGRSVYDIVIIKLPSGEPRTNYFDVTRQRFDWPRIK